MQDTNRVLVLLDIPSGFIPQAQYVCRFFSDAWGLPVETTGDLSRLCTVDIHYCLGEHVRAADGPIVIPFQEALYDPKTVCASTNVDGYTVWAIEDTIQNEVDLIGSTYRLLTQADEQQIDPYDRDALGHFLVTALPQGRRETIDVPLADHHASLLKDRLFRINPMLREHVVPRWPDEKAFVVSLSHDTDAVHLGHPLEIATSAVKLLIGRKGRFQEMIKGGWTFRKTPMTNPYWGFPGWRDFELARKVKSCFYISTPPLKCRRHLNDCKSTVFSSGIDWDGLRALSEEGWEFGLHPTLNARHVPEELSLQKHAIEERLGSTLKGLRHHYLAIDALQPAKTFRQHLEAGFVYDASLGWQEEAGFRAGTSLPFFPYDPMKQEHLDLIELTLSLMDKYVVRPDRTTAISDGEAIINSVRENCGVITFNWHTETYDSPEIFPHYKDTLEALLEPLVADSKVWFATPLEVAQWWKRRSEALQCIS